MPRFASPSIGPEASITAPNGPRPPGACTRRSWRVRRWRARRDPALEAALRHLEALPAPVVTAPRAAAFQAVRARVPDNDADRVFALHAKGKPGEARRKTAELASLRIRRGRRFAGTVTYDFDASRETVGHVPALVCVARSVSAVGQGVDLALARAELLAAPPRPRGIRYTASPDGRLVFGVP